MKERNYTFRQAQAAFDLIAVLQSRDDQATHHLGGPELHRIVHENNCRFRDDRDAECYSQVAASALEADENGAIATALLVANELLGGRWSGDVREFAQFAVAPISVADKKLRGAILRGLDEVNDQTNSYPVPEKFLPGVSRLSDKKDLIVRALCKIAGNGPQHPTVRRSRRLWLSGRTALSGA